MSVIRIEDPRRLSPLRVVMIFLVGLALAGSSLLLSAIENDVLMQGAIPWHAESLLRSVVEVLCLGYDAPTINPGDVKNFVFGVVSGLGVIVSAIALWAGARSRDEAIEADDGDEVGRRRRGQHVSPVWAAQILIGLFLLWSFASSRWSMAPALSLGASILLAISLLWSFALGAALAGRAAVVAARVMIAVAIGVSALAVWYFYGRNPGLRAMYPFGNPTFLAAAMLPAGILSLTAVLRLVFPRAGSDAEVVAEPGSAIASETNRDEHRDHVVWGVLSVIGLVAIGLAIKLADARGAFAGAIAGALAIAFFALRGKWKILIVLLAIAVAAAGASVALAKVEGDGGPRGSTLRFRTYAWSYALRMVAEKPITGFGQGGFALVGDSYASNDVWNDPEVLSTRISHAHNEWLETAADLGSVGLVLIASGILLSLYGAVTALRRTRDPDHRWMLIGLSAALVAMCAEQTFGVGLRVSGVAPWFFTVLGLLWALSLDADGSLISVLERSRIRRLAGGAAGVLIGCVLVAVSQADWSAARSAFEVAGLAQKQQYDDAIRAAQRSTSQLNPVRALRNRFHLCEVNLRAARRIKDRGDERAGRALQVVPVDSRRLQMALGDYNGASAYLGDALAQLKSLVEASPNFFNHGWLESQVNLTRADLATVQAALIESSPAAEENAETVKELRDAAERYVQAAAAALRRELARQPFNELLAAANVGLLIGVQPPAEAIEILAPPLRYAPLRAAYADLLSKLIASGGFEQAIAPVMQQAVRALTVESPIDETGRPIEIWAPEKLRLLARIQFVRGDYAACAATLETAMTGYEAMSENPPIGAVDCLDRLAVAQFLSDPTAPERAIETSRRAEDLAPGSYEGSELAKVARFRRANFLLAADREDEAREILRYVIPAGLSDSELDQEVGVRYSALCQSVLSRREAALLRKPLSEVLEPMRRWIQRALALVPKDPTVHLVAADLEFQAGFVKASVLRLQDAIANGLPLERAKAFLRVARQRMPEEEVLKEALDAIEQFEKRNPKPGAADQRGSPTPGAGSPGEIGPLGGPDEAPVSPQIEPPMPRTDAPPPAPGGVTDPNGGG